MFEIRIHGRGGQGVVTAAELLSIAAFEDGHFAQAFPSFGSERTGAPVASFCRIDEHPIRSREPVSEPDALIVVDPTLLHQVDVFGGLQDDAYLLLNTSRRLGDLGLDPLSERMRPDRMIAVGATDVARQRLGRPLPNAALLGGFAALTRVVTIASVASAITGRFSDGVAEGNLAAAQETYDLVTQQLAELRSRGGLALTVGPSRRPCG